MKKLITLALVFGLGIVASLSAQSAFAAPFNAADKNPNIEVYYPTGPHGVVGENAYHEGQDLVMHAGESPVFQQWFYGSTDENGVVTEGDHSVFMLSKDGTCPNGSYLLENVNTTPDNYWGDYLVTGADYCVRTNDFHVTK